MDEYSDPLQNYNRVENTIHILSTGVGITPEWMSFHCKHILKYQEVFPVISEVNLDLDTTEFREKARQTEVLLNCLVHSVIHSNTFDLKIYLIFNQYIKWLADQVEESNNLVEMLTLSSL